MGREFQVVNVAKRKCIDIGILQNAKHSGLMHGFHADALGLLLFDERRVVTGLLSLVGSWSGDRVHLPNDEEPALASASDGQSVFPYGFDTRSPEDDQRNLYWMAREEFHEVTRWMLKVVSLFGREPFSYVKDVIAMLLEDVAADSHKCGEQIRSIRERLDHPFTEDEIRAAICALPREHRIGSRTKGQLEAMQRVLELVIFLAGNNVEELTAVETRPAFLAAERCLVVHPETRQYISAERFGYIPAIRASLGGPHGRLVARLINKNHWQGPIYVAGEGSAPNQPALITATAARPRRNLYDTALSEFEDISFSAMSRTDWQDFAGNWMTESGDIPLAVCEAAEQGHSEAERYLTMQLGSGWRAQCQAIRERMSHVAPGSNLRRESLWQQRLQ